jgi:prepilin-type N-terminal cleavage/methylation domain-containing protein/prepilin-type processing-associated H-X9-DG protein
MFPSLDRRPISGFSLVELLVVVAIIGVLIGALLPALQAAREASRRAQCGNNVKRLALAALSHESANGFFPTGGWSTAWLGHPDQGFGRNQPGGWIYNILPFIGQETIHDLGATGCGMAIQNANAQRIATPLSALNCPSRRAAALYPNYYRTIFYLLAGTASRLARSDYAVNGGDYVQWWYDVNAPKTLAQGNDPNFVWKDDMSKQTGICYQRSQVTMSNITDGISSTFLIGEKFIDSDHYADGVDAGDSETMYCGDHKDLIRWTGVLGAIGTAAYNNLPRRDRPTLNESNHPQWFGSAHSHSFNMSFCDGSVQSISYSIDAEVYRCLGNRMDGAIANGSQFCDK